MTSGRPCGMINKEMKSGWFHLMQMIDESQDAVSERDASPFGVSCRSRQDIFFSEAGMKGDMQKRKTTADGARFAVPFDVRPVLDPAFDTPAYTVLPGFCDVHVHFREPGFSYKETIATGTAAAARGGFTAVCTMPNLDPVPDNAAHLKEEIDIIRRDAKIAVYPYGALTVGERGEEPAALTEMARDAVAFSDDGRGVQSEELMRHLMKTAKALGKVVVAHCEDNRFTGGCIHAGPYTAAHGYRGIPSEAEWRQVQRDLRLAAETGCAYHVCHISTKESVALVRQAKAAGVDVTCETAPHYLVFCEDDLIEDGRFKMNPPLAAAADREALLAGVADGTVDMIATDHAPHAAAEKSRGLTDSAFGIVGLETAFPALYTHLVKKGVIPLDKLVDLLATNPRRRFGIPPDGYSVWRLDESETVDPAAFLSKGRATPFAGMCLDGVNYQTVYQNKTVYRK